MKKMLIPFLLLAACSLNAQDAKEFQELFGNKKPIDLKKYSKPRLAIAKPFEGGQPNFILPVAPGKRIVQLAQDRMGCVLPDMREYHISNVAVDLGNKHEQLGAIPNPGVNLKVFAAR